MSNLHIAIVHDRPIPTTLYGGTERVVWWLAKALVALDHKVTLIVPKHSYCDFAGIVFMPKEKFLINNLVPKDVDVVHSSFTLNENISKPLITTIHGNGKPGEKFHPNTIFLSKDHAIRHNSKNFVYNGLDPEEYPQLDKSKKEPFCYFLAKAKWKVKNVKGAIKVAKLSKMPIKIIGGTHLSLNKNIKWCGMLGGEKKNELLKKGSSLIFPVRWHEPFGLAVIEALLTGSPVFATPYGSLPELVPNNCGILSNSAETLSLALKNHSSFNPAECIKHVLENFTNTHMANNYLNFYEHVIKGKNISETEPQTLSTIKPQTLLPFE